MLDKSLKYLSDEIGCRVYFRSQIEVLLCESFAGRKLEKKDVFIHGETLHLLSDSGLPMYKQYGKNNDWEVIQAPLLRNYKNKLTL